MSERRLARMAITPELLECWLVYGTRAFRPADKALPYDAKIVGASFDAANDWVELVFQSNTFSPLLENELPPYHLMPVYEHGEPTRAVL